MRSKLLSLGAFLTVGLAACGSSDNGPSYASAADSATISNLADASGSLASNTLDEAFGFQSTTLDGYLNLSKSAGRASGTDLARALLQHALKETSLHNTSLVSTLAPPVHAAPFSECTPTLTGVDTLGDPIDSDGDGAPDNFTANFGSSCVSEDSAGTQRETFSGSLNFHDTGLGFFSYSLTMNNLTLKVEDLTTGDATTIKINGNEASQFAAALAGHSANFSVFEALHSGSTDISLTLQDNETASFDPDNTFSLALGAALPAGVFDYSSDFRVLGTNSGGEVPGNFRFTVTTPTPLHFDPACGSDITAGQLRGFLNGDSNVGFTITWTACDASTVDIFGNTEPTAVAAR